MNNSNSTGALASRLIPENKINFNRNDSISTFKPKILGSKSTTSLLHNPVAGAGTTKADKLRLEVNNRNLNTKTLSNSASALILSPNAAVREERRKQLGASTNHFNDFTDLIDEVKVSDEENDVYDKNNESGGYLKNSFIGSLSLSAQQYNDLFKVPHTFFYLRVKPDGQMFRTVGGQTYGISSTDMRSSAGSVYELELVALELVDKNSYFTLSKEGVTQFRGKVSQFTSLQQWEREFKLFNKIANINFFKVYKRWKVNKIVLLTKNNLI